MPAPLRILQTCFSRSWGGLEIQALEVSRQLQQRGHRLWLACPPGSRLQHEAANADITVLPVDIRSYFHPRLAWELGRFISRQKIQVVHCQLSRDIATLVPAIKLSLRQVPLLLSKRVGSYLTKRDPFHRFTYANVRMVLAISEVIRRNVLETTPVPPDRVITLHDAVDTELFSRTHADGTLLRQELGISESDLVVGFVGRFSPGKGHEELLQAAEMITGDRPDVRFVIVGEASYGEQQYEQRIHALCRSMRLDKVVSFAGFRRDVPNAMAAFDILAFPSHAESFGVVLIEAMAMELPVVSTNCDGILDVVVNGVTGIMVPPRSSGELAAGLMRLINDPVLRARMGSAGRQRVETLFDQRKQTERLEALYEQLVSEGA